MLGASRVPEPSGLQISKMGCDLADVWEADHINRFDTSATIFHGMPARVEQGAAPGIWESTFNQITTSETIEAATPSLSTMSK